MTTSLDWLVVLRCAVDKTSQTAVARQLGYKSSSQVSKIYTNKASDKERAVLAERVIHVLIHGRPIGDLIRKPPPPSKPIAPDTTRRICLKCRQPFGSWGVGNRLCSPCRSSNLHEGSHGGIY